jgi:type II secretory pathway predicted ATPase ExeA
MAGGIVRPSTEEAIDEGRAHGMGIPQVVNELADKADGAAGALAPCGLATIPFTLNIN